MKKILLGVLTLSVVLSSAAMLVFKPQPKMQVKAYDGGYDGAILVGADDDLNFNCKSAYLMDYDTGTVVFEKNADSRYPIASMCKIMTLLLTFEAADEGIINLNNQLVVSENASGMGGSQAFLETNGSYLISDLIKSIVIASANDSSVALAEAIKGSESAFTERMNERARELGLENTLFANCTGLPRPSQYSSAKDVSTMNRELLKHKEYFKYSMIWMEDFVHSGGRVTGLTNTNKLVKFYSGCDGGKTGYTSEAKHCLSATALRDGTRLISTVIGADDSKTRFAAVSSMFNYGFANFKSVQMIDSTIAAQDISITKGKEKAIPLFCENNFSVFVKKGDEKNYKVEYDLPKNLSAPVKQGDIVGKAYVVKGNEVVGEVNVVAGKTVLKKSYFDNLRDTIEEWSLI